MTGCEYTPLCRHRSAMCSREEYRESCWRKSTLDGILDLQAYRARGLKRLFNSARPLKGGGNGD